ncbi:MAG: cysteine biosynthesis protein CysZ [Rhizobiales bacterium]|nr:cysteine biosynthesis protein CysZ [Hyphomicrobiales bacterium]
MFQDAAHSFWQCFSPPFRRVLFISVALTLVVLALLGAGLQWSLNALPVFQTVWLNTIIEVIARGFAVVVLIPLVHPAVSLVAGLFLERIAAKTEETDYPQDQPGTDQPFWSSIVVSIRFTLVLIGLNLLALPFYFFPVINVVLFWSLNGYLLGREYFELVALRHMDYAAANALRRQFRFSIFMRGVVIAFLATIPILNFIAPLFGTAYMVHSFKRFAANG